MKFWPKKKKKKENDWQFGCPTEPNRKLQAWNNVVKQSHFKELI